MWDKWRAGSVAEMVDASLGDQYPQIEMLCCVQIGLLCVQKKPGLRPDASAVVLMLDSQSTSLQAPSRPAFYSGSTGIASRTISSGNAMLHARRFTDDNHLSRAPASENGVTISELEPR